MPMAVKSFCLKDIFTIRFSMWLIIRARNVRKGTARHGTAVFQGTSLSALALDRISVLRAIPSQRFPSGDTLGQCPVSSHHGAMAFLGVDVVPVISKLLQVQIGRPPVHLYKVALLR